MIHLIKVFYFILKEERKFKFKKFSSKLLNKYNIIILATDHDKFNYDYIKKSKKW